jgi:CNT family concentrative nucleoside transporter
VVILAICAALSRNRRAVSGRVVVVGLLLQALLGLLVFGTTMGAGTLQALTDLFRTVLEFSYQGSAFVFGELGKRAERQDAFSLAFQVLPLVIYFAALMALLYHLRVMQVVIYLLARLLGRALRVSGSESMAVTANIFVGMTEAPLVVRPYLERMTPSELMALMTAGFATIAGTVFGIYLAFLGEEYGPFLLAASVMAAPAALVTAKVLVPETAVSETGGGVRLDLTRTSDNLLAAIASGVTDGLKLALNIAAMLIAFYALIALVNWPLGALAGTSIEEVFGYLLRPLAWCLGVDWADADEAGSLLGLKLTTNELVAYRRLQEMIASGANSPRSIKIMTFALCGFANFGSIGVTLGGLGQLVPSRRADLSRLALLAMAGGALASCLTAAVAGIFI